MKRLLAIVLALAMIFAFAACGQSPAEQPSNPPAEQPGNTPAEDPVDVPADEFGTGYKIGMNSFSPGMYAFDAMTNVAKIGTDGIGNELTVYADNFNPDNILADIDKMISSGCDGALWWGILDAFMANGSDIFNEGELPFALYDTMPTEQATIDAMKTMEYFAGCVGADNYRCGTDMGEFAAAQGCTKAIVFADIVGSTNWNTRAQGFMDAFTAAGGEILVCSNVDTSSNAHVEAANNFVSTYSDFDCVYGGSKYAYAMYSALEAADRSTEDVKLFSTDIEPETLASVADGKFAGLNGGHWISALASFCMLQNMIDGHPIRDAEGNGAFLTVKTVPVTPETCELYDKCWIQNQPFSFEDVQHLLYRYNPDVTLQDFIDFCENYSFEGVVKAKLDQGLITAEEAAVAGVK